MENKAMSRKYNKMLEKPVNKLIISLAIPTVISMLVTAIYNTADTYFVSSLGASSQAAVGIVFSLMTVIQAIGFTIGMGSGSWISRLLGEKKDKKASEVASTGFFIALGFGVILAILGVIFAKNIMYTLGASDTNIEYAIKYAKFIFIGAPFMISSFVLNNIMRAEGKAKFAMRGLVTGGILNIFLDPLFIFYFGFGIQGASIATAFSQLVSFCILLSMFLRGKTSSKLSIKNFSKNIKTFLNIVKFGFPSFCRQGCASFATIVLNRCARPYGDCAVGAMTVVGKCVMFIFGIIIGIGQGYQPVVGYNYGAKRYDRVKEAFRFTVIVGMVVMLGSATLLFFFAPEVMSLFAKDENREMTIKIGAYALRAQCVAFPFIPLSVVCNMTFQGVGKSLTATLTSAARQGIFYIPLMIILSKYFELTGIEITQAVADICSCIFVVPFMLKFFAELRKLEKKSDN